MPSWLMLLMSSHIALTKKLASYHTTVELRVGQYMGQKRKSVWTFEGILTFPRTFLLDVMQVPQML